MPWERNAKLRKKLSKNGGDYILSVKGNQGGLEEEVKTACRQNRPVSDSSTVEKGHGRIETCHCEVFDKRLTVDREDRRTGLGTIVKITSAGELADKTETQERYCISSLDTGDDFNKFIRDTGVLKTACTGHLAMVFCEDGQRRRASHAAKNTAAVRKTGLNLKKMPEKNLYALND
jgi:predicted transposase YbfD/YdcC